MDQILSIVNPEALAESYTKILEQMNGSFLFVLIYCLALVLTAFYSYRILKLELSISAALAGGYFGYLLLAPLILANIADTLPEGIDFCVIIGVVCAILGWVLAWVLHKIAVFLTAWTVFPTPYAVGFIPYFVHLNSALKVLCRCLAVVIPSGLFSIRKDGGNTYATKHVLSLFAIQSVAVTHTNPRL